VQILQGKGAILGIIRFIENHCNILAAQQQLNTYGQANNVGAHLSLNRSSTRFSAPLYLADSSVSHLAINQGGAKGWQGWHLTQ